MQRSGGVLDTIGSTPLVELRRLDTGPCRLFVKLENQNPTGSIKDRIGLSMIEAAERDGRIKPGGTLIEATAGNTGLGLALVAAQKGYRLILVIPDKMAQEKVLHLKALGAEVRITRSDVGKGHPEYYQDIAERLAGETPNSFYVNQFANPANPMAHEATTGPEIWAQTGQMLDAVVVGVGSGGTLTGLSRYFARVAPHVEMVLADPLGSILTDVVRTGSIQKEAGSWLVEGIGEDFVPPNCDLSRVRTAYEISDAESFATARELLAREGILGGSSTGTLLAAALRYCRAQTAPRRVVSFVCDSGNKYLSKMYNDFWMFDQGLLERPREGSLLDLIVRRYAEGSAVTVRPEDTLLLAYRRMKLFDVSQVPVMDSEQLIGIVDESDIMQHVHLDPARFNDAVSTAMVTQLETVSPSTPVAELMPIFARDHVVIVAEGRRFVGLITRIDLLNYLRKQL
ncbi:MAG: pyridoxal-phosphate dependent enzyme [Sinimarinibacterium flocculans]|uniref:pyridoxal-phosphate dependent enzyme n=1 Tax=Sinimarinibacterium flocculans TaxID=985250 RepID=UPI003C3860AB